VKTIDPAFNSRISVKLFYDDLEDERRDQIWRQLLKLAGFDACDKLDMQNISKHDLNGREIKNIVKLAIAKTKGKKEVLNGELLEKEILT